MKDSVRSLSLYLLIRPRFAAGFSSKSGQFVIDGFWGGRKRLRMPDNFQIDNTLSFSGSLKHPQGTGPLIRLRLNDVIEPWFIPKSEPRRSGMMELFIDRYQNISFKRRSYIRMKSFVPEHRLSNSIIIASICSANIRGKHRLFVSSGVFDNRI